MPIDIHQSAFTVEAPVGRLIEARIFALRTAEDVDAYSAALVDRARRMRTGVAPVLLADHRPATIYPQPVTGKLIELFMQMNSRLERIAIIASPSNATMVLQMERLVREAKETKRKVTYAPREACDHLAPALDEAEIARARAFLNGWTKG